MTTHRPMTAAVVRQPAAGLDQQAPDLRHDLTFEISMALNAADIGDPICSQAASICAEIASQHCAAAHPTDTAADLGNRSTP